MARQIIALLVGIDEYPEGVSNLMGCVKDVNNMHSLLINQYDVPDANILVLRNGDANRKEVIHAFRTHLSRAQKGDTVFFHYSGHGSREDAPKEFWKYSRKNQTLVLSDSRTAGGLDLANKELAVLLEELALTEADMVLNIDSCHSGGITRGEHDLLKQNSRQSAAKDYQRKLEDYIGGYYKKMFDNTGKIIVPEPPHLVMSACTAFQVAQETPQHTGVFTSALLQALQNPEIHYQELFKNIKIIIKEQRYKQQPLHETKDGFNSLRHFLTHEAAPSVRIQKIYFMKNQWLMDEGAIQGIPMDGTKPTTMNIFEEDVKGVPAEPLGKAIVREVLPQQSVLELEGFSPDTGKKYDGKIDFLPDDQLVISIGGNPQTVTLFENVFRQQNPVLATLRRDLASADYTLDCQPKLCQLFDTKSGLLVQGIEAKKVIKEKSIKTLIEDIEFIARWKKLLALQNYEPKIAPEKVMPVLYQHVDNASTITHPLQTTIYSSGPIEHSIDIQNKVKQTLYVGLIELRQNFEIKATNLDLEYLGTINIKAENIVNVLVRENEFEAWYAYQVIVSTSPVDNFTMTQEKIRLGNIKSPLRSERALASRSKGRRFPSIKNDWFTHLISLKLVKEQGDLTTLSDASIVTARAHPRLEAQVCFESAFNQIREEPAGVLINALGHNCWEAINLLKKEDEKEQVMHVLTLSQLQHAASVTVDTPLELSLEWVLAPDETLMAMSFYGQKVFRAGEANAPDTGKVNISITQLVPHPDRPETCQICFVKGKKEGLKIDFG